VKWFLIIAVTLYASFSEAALSVTREGALPTPSPGAISGLTLWIDPAQNVTLDGSSRVSQIVDVSPNAVVFSQATSGSRPDVHAAAVNGLPALRADGTTRLLSSAAQPSITDYTIFAVYKIASGTATWFSKGSTQALNELFLFTGASTTYAATSYDGTGAFQHFYQVVMFPHTGYNVSFQIACATKSGPHVAFYVNGASQTPTGGSSVAYINSLGERWDIFGRDGSQNTEIAELLVYNRRLSVTELKAVDYYLKNKFGISTAFTPTNVDLPAIFFIGDSITAGVGSVSPVVRTMDDATVGLNHTARVYDSASMGVSGGTIQESRASMTTDLIPYLNNGDIVEIWKGTNDIFFGRTAAQINGDIDAVCTAIRGTGKSVKIVLTTVINRLTWTGGMGAHDGAESGVQATVNTHIRGLVGTLADAVFDAQANTNLRTTSTAPNTYFQSDGVHLTTAGENIISDGWITAINSL
jgi:lysophospholipase L1-like esterase